MSIFSGRLGRKNFIFGVLLLAALTIIPAIFLGSMVLVSLNDARQQAKSAAEQTAEQQQQNDQLLQQYGAQTDTSAQVQTQTQPQ
jgi:hypothetical protein